MNNLFLIGFMGAGKSSVSAGLGRMLGREVVEMDQRIAAQEGMSIPELFAQKGEPYFRACETVLIKSFAQGAPRIVSCGGGVPLREENVAAMRLAGGDSGAGEGQRGTPLAPGPQGRALHRRPDGAAPPQV